MYQNSSHAGCAGHSAGVLTGGTAETKERELGGIESLASRNLADRIRHGFHGHFEERLRDRFGVCTGLRGEGGKLSRGDLSVDRRAAVVAEERGQSVRSQMP